MAMGKAGLHLEGAGRLVEAEVVWCGVAMTAGAWENFECTKRKNNRQDIRTGEIRYTSEWPKTRVVRIYADFQS